MYVYYTFLVKRRKKGRKFGDLIVSSDSSDEDFMLTGDVKQKKIQRRTSLQKGKLLVRSKSSF